MVGFKGIMYTTTITPLRSSAEIGFLTSMIAYDLPRGSIYGASNIIVGRLRHADISIQGFLRVSLH